MDNSKIIETLLELTSLVVRKDNEIKQLSERLATTNLVVPPSKPIIFRELFKDEDTVGNGKAFEDPESIQQMVKGLEDTIIVQRKDNSCLEAELKKLKKWEGFNDLHGAEGNRFANAMMAQTYINTLLTDLELVKAERDNLKSKSPFPFKVRGGELIEDTQKVQDYIWECEKRIVKLEANNKNLYDRLYPENCDDLKSKPSPHSHLGI